VSCTLKVRGRQAVRPDKESQNTRSNRVQAGRTIIGKFRGLPAITKELYAQKKVLKSNCAIMAKYDRKLARDPFP
jgi:hypothetical protein